MVCASGLSAGLEFIKQIGKGVVEFAKTLASLAIQFPDDLGITDWLWTRGIYTAIAIIAALLCGYAFSRKEKKKLLGVISSIVGIVSAILAFA